MVQLGRFVYFENLRPVLNDTTGHTTKSATSKDRLAVGTPLPNPAGP